jgi:tellurite resistance protein
MTDKQLGLESGLKFFPISTFAAVMGIAGLSIATKQLEELFDLLSIGSTVLLVSSIAIWLAVFAAYALKALRYPEAVIEELNHPVRLSFFPTASIGLLLIAIPMVEINALLANLIWWIGSLAQLGLMLVILDRWVHREHFLVEHNSPAWFIPVVGNLLVPLAGVELGYVALSYFFFAIGIFFWLPLLAISLNRAFFFPPIPKKLLPTLFILIAPPAVGFLAWVKIQQGEIDDFAVLIYFFGLFTTLMLVSQAKRFMNLDFSLSWWAFTFPLTAITVASFRFFELVPQLQFQIIALSLYAVTVLVVAMVFIATLFAFWRKEICVSE